MKEENGFIVVHGHFHTPEGYVIMMTDKHIFNSGCCCDCCEGYYGILDIKKDKNGKLGENSLICYN